MEQKLHILDNAVQAILLMLTAFFLWFQVNLDTITGLLLFFGALLKLYITVREARSK